MDFGARGLRGLRVACQVLPVTEFNTSCDLARYVTDLTFLGLPGMMDPPRPEVTDAIKRCNDAGIAVTMITGAHKSTATAIARELGLEGDARAGIELDRLDPTELWPRRSIRSPYLRVWHRNTRSRSCGRYSPKVTSSR